MHRTDLITNKHYNAAQDKLKHYTLLQKDMQRAPGIDIISTLTEVINNNHVL